MSPALTLERTGPGDVVARVTLNRPEARNAFDASLIAELRATFGALAREKPTSLRAVVPGRQRAIVLRRSRYRLDARGDGP